MGERKKKRGEKEEGVTRQDRQSKVKRTGAKIFKKKKRARQSRPKTMNEKQTNLNAPAIALGPNHIPTSFPAALLASAMRCTPNGAAGASRSHESRRGCSAYAGRVGGGKGAMDVEWRDGSKGRRYVSIEVLVR
jgi:hypothetical protein